MTERPTGEAPRTEAGKALNRDLDEWSGITSGDNVTGFAPNAWARAIARVEREAAAAPPDRVISLRGALALIAQGRHPADKMAEAALAADDRQWAAPVAAPEGLSLDVEELTDIIEQAIFETDTGLAAALLAADRIHARLSPSSGESGSPQPIDEDRLFEALSFLGEDDILADGSLWKVKEIALNAAAEYNGVGSGSPGEPE